MSRRKTIFKPMHSEPGPLSLGYILLPYGMFYEKTRSFLDAKPGDVLRFYNGPDFEIVRTELISGDRVCDILCRIRYGVSWKAAFKRWISYAVMEGNGRDILSPYECILVAYKSIDDER